MSPPLEFLPAKPPLRRQREAVRPPAPAPPPVTRLHVLAVTALQGPPNITHWAFDRDIVVSVSPPVYPAGLKINGAGPVAMLLLAPRLLELSYPLAVAGGAWSCPADAVGIESTEGYKLAAGSGTVA